MFINQIDNEYKKLDFEYLMNKDILNSLLMKNEDLWKYFP